MSATRDGMVQRQNEAFRAWKGAEDELKAKPGDGPATEVAEKAKAAFFAANDELEKFEATERASKERSEALARAEQEMRTPVGKPVRHGVESDGPTEQHKKLHQEAFRVYLRRGERAAQQKLAGLGPDETFALLGTQNDLGGFLVPDQIMTEILRDLALASPIASMCRTIPCSSAAVTFPTIQSAGSTPQGQGYPSGFSGSWQGEGYVTGGTAPTVQNKPTFGQTRIPVHSWQPNAVEITQELLQDAIVPVDSIVAELVGQTLGLDLDLAVVSGSGVGQPMGITTQIGVTGAGPATVVTGSASALAINGLLDLIWGGLPGQYAADPSAALVMRRSTFGAILKLADTSHVMPWKADTAPANTFLGYQVKFSEFVDAVGTNKYPIIFGAFRYYGIARRQDLRLMRLDERFAPNVGLLPTARIGGQILRYDAFRVQKCST